MKGSLIMTIIREVRGLNYPHVNVVICRSSVISKLMYNGLKDFSMSNMRIRNMFLLVTALAVMFLLASGQSDEEIDSKESIFMRIYRK